MKRLVILLKSNALQDYFNFEFRNDVIAQKSSNYSCPN